MTPARKRKMGMIVFVLCVIAICTGLILYALSQNINLFYTPTQIASGQVPRLQAMHVGGMVEKGSIVRDPNGLDVQFKITDFETRVTVFYTGILPDLFRDGQGVVVEGAVIDAQHVRATRVLAKHDANYMPPEVRAALKNKVKT